LNNFKDDYADLEETNKEVFDAIEEVVNLATTRIVITLCLEIVCFVMTYWWILELRKQDGDSDASEETVEMVPTAEVTREKTPTNNV
jgi:hypothetical protein